LLTPTPENQAGHRIALPKGSAALSLAIIVALTLMLTALWVSTHRYQGFIRDGELYAVQAAARVNPALQSDVFLKNTSQDRYTLFSPLYASFIDAFGLRKAGLRLFVLCALGFLTAAWALGAELFDRDTAWLTTVMLIATVGDYGASGIFHYSEDYLTARSLAEALVVASLALHFRGWKRLALVIAISALFIHPLMALPGLLLLICLRLSTRQAVFGAAAGLLATAGVALIATANPGFLKVMDAAWLDVVRERSHFLFLKYWTLNDWQLHVRPFMCLALSAMVIDNQRVRRLCMGAALVGAAGLGVAFIAGAIGPVAILLQGQAWRWFWIAGFVSVLLIAPTALRAWNDEKCGPMCATLLVAGWTFPAIDSTATIALALVLWSLRSRITVQTGRWLRWAGFAVIGVVLAWALANCWSLITSPRAESSPEPLLLDRVRSILGLQVLAVTLCVLFWYWIRSRRSVWLPTFAAVSLAALTIAMVPGSLRQTGTVGSPAEIEEFADWRNAIPPNSNVVVVSPTKAAAFIWFTLGRPSFLSVDQSSGVVFSRATALEVRRRSEVLLPIMDPDWKILSYTIQKAQGKKPENPTRPLNPTRLVAICRDSELGFVIAKEKVGFEPLRHSHVGQWKDWNLYDCRQVRSAAPTA
jgi:hypothetical protein